jgi:two-component system C4-dicarboxylate transport sensor histidine kinase DctB
MRLALASATAFGLAGWVALFMWQVQRMRWQRRRELSQLDGQIKARIAHSTQHLQEQVQALEQTEKMLRQTTDSAVQAGKLAVLGQMSAGITHELTQPLTAMRHYAENALIMMQQGQLEHVQHNLQRMENLTVRMEQMVTHLRFHARKQPQHIEAVDVHRALEGALDLLQSPPHRARQRVRTELPAHLHVMADAVRLEQVLVNLLRNALEAAADEGVVEVRATVHAEVATIHVLDRGPGMDEDAMPHLFEPFFSTKPAGGGLGLGLAVSKMIINHMGGRIHAANRTGGGAEFVCELPLAPLDNPTEAP